MSYVSSYHHCVFSTKDAAPSSSRNYKNVCGHSSAASRGKIKCALWKSAALPTMCIFFSQRPTTMPIAKAMQLIKGGSSKWIHENFPDHRLFAWHGAFSVSVSQLDTLIAYIKNQEPHHRKMTF